MLTAEVFVCLHTKVQGFHLIVPAGGV